MVLRPEQPLQASQTLEELRRIGWRHVEISWSPFSHWAEQMASLQAAFPSLALPAGSYPLVEAELRRIGLWNDASRMRRYRRERWEGRVENDLVIGYGTPLSLRVCGGQLCPLPLQLPFHSGDAVVVHRDFLGHPALETLLQHLRTNLQQLAQEHPEITLMPDAAA